MKKCSRCQTAHYCRRHKKNARLLHRDELPRSMWINEHIKTGYRPTNLSHGLCIKSVFEWNNETINIWSHLLGFCYFSFMQWNSNVHVLPSLKAPFVDHLVTTVSVAGAQICMLLSVLYHTFGCIGIEQHDKWLRADVFGISIGIIGMYLSGIYMSFYCFSVRLTLFKMYDPPLTCVTPFLECVILPLKRVPLHFKTLQEAMNTYFAALLIIIALCIYVPSKSHLRTSKVYGRIGYLHLIYGLIVIFGLYPALHWIQVS